MASVRVERMSAELGRLPHVCMCCGQPAASMAHHKFYYDPLWLATIGMLLPWYVRYHFASQSVVVPAPLCARHAGRLKLPTYLGYGFAASLLLAAPIMVLAVVLSNGMTTAAGIVFFLVFLYVIAALVGLMAVRLATPRMTAYDYRSITFGSVSSGFAEAITGRPLPGMYAASAAAAPGAFPAPGPAGHVQYPNYGPAPPLTRQQWIFIGAVTGSLAFVAFMMFFGVVYLRYRSGARHREEVARAQQWHNDQLAQFQEKQAENEALHRRMMEQARSAPAANFTPAKPAAPPPPPPATSPPTASPMPATNIPVSLPASVQAATGNQATPVAGTSASPPGAGFSAPGFPNSRFPPADFGSSLPESARPTRERPETFTARRNGPEFPPDTRTAGQAAELTPGLDIWALWGTRVWYRSRVVSLEGDQVRVHYIGWPNASDDTLPIANIRIVVGEAPAANSPAASSAPAAATARTWSDSSGQFKIDAEFVSLEGDMVTLRKTDGKAIRLPIGKLSQADQAVARELAASQ